MKLQWFWNATYEGLMESIGGWLTGQASIEVVHIDMRPLAEPGTGTIYWYWTCIYRPK